MAKKTFDLCVKTGEYNGKGQWENIGSVIETSNGEMMLLKRTFNPAGVPNPDNKDSIIISRFAVKEKAQGGGGSPPDDSEVPF